jgi:hypothetical protein
MYRDLLASMLAVGCFFVLVPARAQADGSWIDRKPLSGWNVAGASVPRAPKPQADDLVRCASEVRHPQTPVDRAVAAAGWRLFGPYQLYNGEAIVFGQSDADGMCRPIGYQGFVFVDGTFAGTLAPKPMDARTDGAADVPQLFDATSFTVQFERYTASDALCCPSRTSSVTFKVERRSGKPVVAPADASTTKNAS